MKTTIENYKGNTFEIECFFMHKMRGYGQWDIHCEVKYGEAERLFKLHSTDSKFRDSISDMKSDGAIYQEIQQAYFEKFFDDVEEVVLEWVESINEN